MKNIWTEYLEKDEALQIMINVKINYLSTDNKDIYSQQSQMDRVEAIVLHLSGFKSINFSVFRIISPIIIWQ